MEGTEDVVDLTEESPSPVITRRRTPVISSRSRNPTGVSIQWNFRMMSNAQAPRRRLGPRSPVRTFRLVTAVSSRTGGGSSGDSDDGTLRRSPRASRTTTAEASGGAAPLQRGQEPPVSSARASIESVEEIEPAPSGRRSASSDAEIIGVFRPLQTSSTSTDNDVIQMVGTSYSRRPPQGDAAVLLPLSERLARQHRSGTSNGPSSEVTGQEIQDIVKLTREEKKEKAKKSAALLSSPGNSPITCPICFESYKELKKSHVGLIATFCGHVFCSTCVDGLFRVPGAVHCPTCRKRLTNTLVHPLYI